MSARCCMIFDLCKPILRRAWLPLALAGAVPVCCAQDGSPTQRILTVDEIVSAMVSHNQARAMALQGYVGRRTYDLQYRGFPDDRSADMTVEVRYIAPAVKQFTVISENGSKFIIDHVLKRLFLSEQEAQSSSNQKEIALGPQNYRFDLLGQEITSRRRLYVLRIVPKVANKFAYRGKVWIDGTDFAVVRIEAEPAKNPSFWISHTHIEQKYAKFGSFWLPVQNTSTSKIRVLHGTATLQIEYRDYAVDGSLGTRATSVHATATHQSIVATAHWSRHCRIADWGNH